ncbi:MAG: glutamine-hydrolyzing carbamoyl-phosphate synthase small subunit [Bacteroidales bacterium]|nr:glutamine-hydrolyzing carbamoyl-phosphate synthase small subunit [Bacteroidales bacterium]
MHQSVKLILQDGSEFTGYSFGAECSVSGELVFNTAMTGYPESLTDPSYHGQILVASYPLIGNYGVPPFGEQDEMLQFYESDKIQVSGLVISDYSEKFSHWNAQKSLHDWMEENKVPGIYGLDTRRLTKILREKGAMLAKIIYKEEVEWHNPNKENLVAKVSVNEKQIYGNGQHRILLIDCGVKNNIIRHLLKRDTTVIRVPWDYDISQENYDALFISNGPGDPKQCQITVENITKAYQKDNPIFGICLGNQLMALAADANTYKLKYGHRSHNQPVLHVNTNRAYITSQNHGFAVDNNSLNKDWKPYFTNLNDDTNEGFSHVSKPFFSTQFHPEASSGPTDTEFLFDEFIDKIVEYKKKWEGKKLKVGS